MSPALHLMLLPDDPDGAPRNLFADAHGRPQPHAPGPGEPCLRVLAVPAQALVLRRVVAGAASPAQARAAAWFALEGKLAVPRESLDWVVAEPTADGSRWVAGLAHGLRADWAAKAAARGFRPDRIVPDCLLLPAPVDPDAASVFESPDGITLVRGAGHAFAVEADLARHLLAGTALERIATDDTTVLLRGAREPALPDLSVTADSAAHVTRAVPTRRLLALAAALVLSPLLVWTAQALRHDLAASRLQAEAARQLNTVAPDAAGPGRPLARARAALARRQAPDRFGQLVAPLLAAQSQAPGSQLELLVLQPDGVLEVRWLHGPAGLPADLAQTLADHGVAFAQTDTEPAGEQSVTTLLLSELP